MTLCNGKVKRGKECRTYLKQRWIEELALMVYGDVSM
jgi:hypothetical protein